MILYTGNCLRQTRLSNKKTQKEMAKLFEVSRGTYSCWESRYKHRVLPSKVCNKFCFVIGILSTRYFISKINVINEAQEEYERKFKKESIWKRILKWIMHKN